jgi:hypothetical protein
MSRLGFLARLSMPIVNVSTTTVAAGKSSTVTTNTTKESNLVLVKSDEGKQSVSGCYYLFFSSVLALTPMTSNIVEHNSHSGE